MEKSSSGGGPTPEAIREESQRVRRLQLLVNLVTSVISQGNLPVEEAAELVASTKRAALNLFPDKELAYDLIYKPRLQRLMREVYRLQ
ncbi:MAG TPA: hypothetical protein VNN17_04830 [Terriglobia bacterium]|nr:hypothetical protein [Terriglobia bacterium]